MSEYKINYSDYKASGVYFIEVDNTISAATRQRALRLAVVSTVRDLSIVLFILVVLLIVMNSSDLLIASLRERVALLIVLFVL